MIARSIVLRKLLAAAEAGLFFLMPAATALGDDANGGRTVVNCNGGAQEAVLSVTNNISVSTASSSVFVAIPNTTVSGGASGGPGDLDTYRVTFAGEANGSLAAGSWQARAVVSINGGAFAFLDPVGPNTFQSGKKASNNSMTWCTRIAATASTTFRIEWKALGGETATIDDYITSVERSN